MEGEQQQKKSMEKDLVKGQDGRMFSPQDWIAEAIEEMVSGSDFFYSEIEHLISQGFEKGDVIEAFTNSFRSYLKGYHSVRQEVQLGKPHTRGGRARRRHHR
jgi:hypothetical protein